MAEQDPLISAWFGIEFKNHVQGAFQECTGLSAENPVVDYIASGPKGEYVYKKIPGRAKWGNITLKRGVTDSMDLWKWRQLVEEGKIADASANGSIILFNQQGDEIAHWDLTSAWPTKISGPDFNAAQNNIGIETLELVHEGLKRVK